MFCAHRSGDSITAGVHSSGPTHSYPSQLGDLLGSGYAVTNLGACGSTLLKKSNSPYWERPQYKTLTVRLWLGASSASLIHPQKRLARSL